VVPGFVCAAPLRPPILEFLFMARLIAVSDESGVAKFTLSIGRSRVVILQDARI
jgi:hypothetical protein